MMKKKALVPALLIGDRVWATKPSPQRLKRERLAFTMAPKEMPPNNQERVVFKTFCSGFTNPPSFTRQYTRYNAGGTAKKAKRTFNADKTSLLFIVS
jgi:hypothetical protein